MKDLKVICLPHAGGMASSYVGLKRSAAEYMDFRLVELAGRGSRTCEPLYETLEQAVEDIYEQIKNEIEESDYVLFGHSMGSWLAYELYYKIKSMGSRLPLHLFFSGNTPPAANNNTREFDKMSDKEFIDYIVENGQTSREMFEIEELRDIFLPVLKSDYRILENYKLLDGRERINENITVLGGLSDNMISGKLEDWGKMTDKKCSIHYFEGDHFYLFQKAEEIVDIIYSVVGSYNNI